MFRSGLLVLTAPVTSLHHRIPSILHSINSVVQKTLYVHIVPITEDDTRPSQKNVPFTSDIRKFVTGFYSSAACICQHLDVRILLSNISSHPVIPQPQTLMHSYEVILTDDKAAQSDHLVKYISAAFPSQLQIPLRTLQYMDSNVTTNQSSQPSHATTTEPEVPAEKRKRQDPDSISDHIKTYDNVVLGGTFDRIHTGHKILLGEACMMCKKSLTVGVTDTVMNTKKTICELIEPTPLRIEKVQELLQDLKPALEYRVVPIVDPFGPSIVDPDLQCIVVSEETIRGGEAVNRRRKEKGLTELETYIIELVEDCFHSPEEEVKISSSSFRKRLLGTILKEPQLKSNIPASPYIIGLTGGIASGKSAVCKRLEKLGAATVDCDKLGHQAYVKGTATFDKVVEAFGSQIVGEDGEINRKALGAIVFSDPNQLLRLNQLVWPAIADLAQAQIREYTTQGKTVVVLDAAVLLEANWDAFCHEVWVSVIPKDEAVRRIVDRNKLTEEAATQRINSQLSNQERVDKAHVVISTLWEPEVTQQQVEKAWSLLQERVKSAKK